MATYHSRFGTSYGSSNNFLPMNIVDIITVDDQKRAHSSVIYTLADTDTCEAKL